jgi:hypothetical protein
VSLRLDSCLIVALMELVRSVKSHHWPFSEFRGSTASLAVRLEPAWTDFAFLGCLHHDIDPFEMVPERGKGDSVQLLLLEQDVTVSCRSVPSPRFTYLLLRCIGQPIDQQIFHHDVVLLIDIVEEVSGTTAFIVGKFSFEWLAALRKCSLLHSFEGVMVVVRVDLEDDVLAVPSSEVVEFVYAAACDHLC